jgi:cyclophilin family peptidyl-prolyl cis-trans isomerase
MATDPENTLVLETTKGRVVIALRPDLAPGHVERIKTLARRGFYDGIVFHRVIDGFMAQTGCPKGTGTGGSDLPDLKAEFNAEPHVRGVCSMARSNQPNSANSQFFICYEGCGSLTGQYTLFGEVVAGMDVVDKIKKGNQGNNGQVSGPDKIDKMQLAADAR